MFKMPKLTPELLMVLPLAVLLDVIGIVILLCGLDDFGLLDIVGICTIGLWSLLKLGKIPASNNRKDFLRRIFTGKKSRFFTTFGGELIPYVGALPFLTLGVYHQLMQQDEALEERKQQIENAKQSQQN
jgi:hypothetical protein